MFRIVLHLLNKPIVSLAQCEEIAKQLSMTSSVGFDPLCWHKFRIIGTNFGGISIEHNASIIGSDLPNCGCG